MAASKILPDRQYVSECLDYDPATGIFRWRDRPVTHFQSVANHTVWRGQFPGRVAGWTNTIRGYVSIAINQRSLSAHRLAWLLMYGEPVPAIIDHIDRDPSNNRISNLRAASPLDSSANTGGWKSSKTGVKGVRQRQVSKKFEAHIRRNGKVHWLGCFDTIEAAAAARREAAKRLQGEFAHLE